MTSRLEKNKKERKKIEKSEKRKKTKKIIINFLKVFFGFLILILCIISSIYYFSTGVIAVREYSDVYPTLPKEYHGFKIVQFGDLYYDNNYTTTLETLIKKINKLKPDLVVFTGGLINKKYNISDKTKEKIKEQLSSISSSVGKFYVLSDTDNEISKEILNDSDFTFLNDSTELIYSNSTTPILLHGILHNYNVNYNQNKNLFKINIIHNAYKAEEILNFSSPDIIMAGKTLNGQIRVPFQESFFKTQNQIMYKKNYTNNNTKIFITGGIGTNNIPLRIFNYPSINFYRLRSY